MLFIVSTPIGNLEDMTYRAVRVLSEVAIIAAEDTRRIGKLLSHYDITGKKLVSYHDKNKVSRTKHLLNILNAGHDVALVSDNGTPCISDPGFYLVREAIAQEIQISPVPGASAILAGLVGSGLPTARFTFMGFFPRKVGQQKKLLGGEGTVVFYESPHRIAKTLTFLAEHIPHKQIVIGRELTKKFEEYVRGTAAELAGRDFKGEIVLILSL